MSADKEGSQNTIVEELLEEASQGSSQGSSLNLPLSLGEAPPDPVSPPVNQVTSLPGRQELTIRRFTQYCTDPLQWGVLLFHTVGTGKTIVSMLTALNSIADMAGDTKIVVIAPPGIFEANFLSDFKKLPNWAPQQDRFVNYPIDKLIGDINTKKIPAGIFDDAIVIIDEGHRLLQKNGKDSEQAGADVDFHPAIIDTTFNLRIRKAKRVIIMTGTPLQADISDICKLLNFVSKTNEFTLEKYAPITVSTSLRQNLLLALRDVISSPTLINLLTAAGSAGLRLLTTSEVEPTAAPSMTPSQLMIKIWIGFLATTVVVCLIKARARERAVLGDHDRAAVSNLPLGIAAVVATAATATFGSGSAASAAAEIFSTVAGATSTRSIVRLLGASTVNQINDFMEILNEPDWNMELLAHAASPHMSIYDPIVQKELKKNFSKSTFADYMANPNTFSDKVEPIGDTSDFPKKTRIVINIPYTDAQMTLLEQMYIGELPLDMKRVLYLNEYEMPVADPSSKFNFVRRYGRMIGNFSDDITKYLAIINPDGTQYIVEKRSENVPPPPPTLFGCPKFDAVLNILKQMRATGRMDVMSDTGVIENRDQPHLCDPTEIYAETEVASDINKQYLPIVYSYTELYGTALFAAFLTARGYSYILLHSNQSPEELALNIAAGKNVTYPILPLESPEGGPLCIILHPKFTEGYDFKHNPAIFTLEPCNTVGDQLQVHGRIFRRYDKPLKAKIKTVTEFVCVDQEENANFSAYTKKFHASLEKIRRTKLILSPAAIVDLFRTYKFISPDAWATKRLNKEAMKLATFENGVYGGSSGDIVASHYCLAHTEHPVADCNPLDGTGCQPKDDDIAVTNTERHAQRTRGTTGELPSPESHTWEHVTGKLAASGLNSHKGGRRTRRRRAKRSSTRKQ